MQNENRGNWRYVFVWALQRSGTRVIARNLAGLENCEVARRLATAELKLLNFALLKLSVE